MVRGFIVHIIASKEVVFKGALCTFLKEYQGQGNVEKNVENEKALSRFCAKVLRLCNKYSPTHQLLKSINEKTKNICSLFVIKY